MSAADLPHKPDISPAVAQQAVAWLLELQAATEPAAILAAIEQWCQQHPEHQQAWQHIKQLEAQFAILANPRHARLAQQAITAPELSRRHALKTLSLLLVAGSAGYWALNSGALNRWQADYHTAVGEQRTIVLADGTELILNSGSALTVDYTPTQRRLLLLQGELYIHTGQDAQLAMARPFFLDVEQGRMQPLGTRFAVRLLNTQCRLAVYEGQVQLSPHQYNHSLIVGAGQSTLFSRQGWQPTQPVQQQETAWTQGMIVVTKMPLASFIAELSRYRPGVLRVDPRIATLTVSGTYPVTQTEQVLQALTAALPVKITRRTRYWVTLIPA